MRDVRTRWDGATRLLVTSLTCATRLESALSDWQTRPASHTQWEFGRKSDLASTQGGGLGVCHPETPCLPWPADHSAEAVPFDSLGNHRYRLRLPSVGANSGPILAVRVTLPWRRQDNVTRPLAVRLAAPGNTTTHEQSNYELPFLVLNATDASCDLVIKPTPANAERGLPRPWLQNMAYKWLGPETNYLGSIARVNSTVPHHGPLAASGGSWPGAGPEKAMDGLTEFVGAASMALCDRICQGWAVGCSGPPCGEEHLVIDVGGRANIDGFALWSNGDGVHDPKNMSLLVGPNVSGPWKTIATFQGKKSVSTEQTFLFPPTFSRFFKWVIHDRYTPYQAYVKEVQLRAAVTAPPGYLPQHATRANESTVIASTGAEKGSEAWKIADGKVVLRLVPPGNINELVGEGWNAGGTDSKGANYAVFDLRKDMHIIGFAVYSAGDVTHDPNEIQIHTSFSPSGPWNTVVTVNGKAGDDGLQEFGGFSATSRYWRFYIASTHKPQYHQAMIKEVFWKPHPDSPVTTTESFRELMVSDGPFEQRFTQMPNSTEILVYYQPYQIGDWTKENNVSYKLPRGADVSFETASAAWKAKVAAVVADDPDSILNVTNVTYEARGPNFGHFNAYSQMEQVATAREVSNLTEHYTDPVLLWLEPRENTVRMRKHLPLVWTQNGPTGNRTVHLGTAARNEYFVFQIAIHAARTGVSSVNTTFSDLRGEAGGHIGSTRLSSPNVGGYDSRGRRFKRSIRIEKGEVGVLFIGLNLTANDLPQEYKGNVSLELGLSGASLRSMSAVVRFALKLETGPVLQDRGDSDRTKMSRLRWLDSQIGLDARPASRFEPLVLDTNTSNKISTWSTDVIIGDNGLPRQIVRRSPSPDNYGTPELLAQPMAVRVTDSSLQSFTATGQVNFAAAQPDLLKWISLGEAIGQNADLNVSTTAQAEADGVCMFGVTISNNGPQIDLRNVVLEMPLRKEAVPYFMGLGKPGGYRPSTWKWNWIVDHTSSIANSAWWIGNVDLGVRLKLRGTGAEWDVPEHAVHGISDVPSWGGSVRENVSRTAGAAVHNLTIFNGGVNLTEPDSSTVLVSAYSGPQTIPRGQQLTFAFELQLTPTQPFDPSRQLGQRYSQLGGMTLPTSPTEIVAFVDHLFTLGIRTINIHQGANINMFINWPFSNSSIVPLTIFADQIHKRGGRLKLYYTTRELSTRVDILWPLRSLGTEILDDWTTMDRPEPGVDGPGGMSWLQEHLQTGYEPCWDTYLGNGTFDTSVCNIDSGTNELQDKHRWFNYYTQGLHDLMTAAPHIDGLYLDGIAYDRLTMKRARKIMDDANPNALVDFHGGNSFKDACTMLPNGTASGLPYGSATCPGLERQWACSGGCVSTALAVMDHMPYFDYTLFGEQFSYENTPPDYWLVEISNIPYGLMGEMLGAPHPANPWRGMIYGMVVRYGPYDGANKTEIWRLWDRFDIVHSEMLGYWNTSCPVNVTGSGSDNCSDVLATVYLHRGERALVSVASWAEKNVSCTFTIDWSQLGFLRAPTTMHAPAVDGFQNETNFSVTQPFPVMQARGWLFWIEAAR